MMRISDHLKLKKVLPSDDFQALHEIDPLIEPEDTCISDYITACGMGFWDGIDGWLPDEDDIKRMSRVNKAREAG